MEAHHIAHPQMSPAKSQQQPLQQDVVQAGTDQGFHSFEYLSCEDILSSVADTPYMPLGSRANSSSRSEDGDTPDSPAVAQQQVHAQHSPHDDVNAATPPRRVCLEWVEAAKAGDCMELRRLLRAWPCLLNHQVGGLQCTAAHWAAANGHADALQQLLEWGADVMVQTATGCLPLHSAAAAGRAECAQQLLLMADPALQQQQLTAENEDGLTAAALALRHGHKLVQGFLSQATAAAFQASEPVSELAQQVHPQHQKQQQQEQPVKQAGMRRGFLLGGPARPSGENSNPNTPTNSHCSSPAAESPVATPSAAVEGPTADGAASTTQQHGPWNSTVDNPLFGVACSPVKQQVPCQHPAAAAAPPQAPSRLGAAAFAAGGSDTAAAAAAPQQAAAASSEGPVHEQNDGPAAKHDAVNAIACMQREQGLDDVQQSASAAAGIADVPAAAAAAAATVDRIIGRAWLDAARAGDLSRLQELLQQEPLLLDYRGTGTSYAFVGNSALHWAAAKGHRRCVKWLLQQGAAVGAVNEAGASPLHTAVEHGQPGCAQLLVVLGGGDVGAQDGYGQTVLSLARSTGVRGEQQLLLWDEARKLQQLDRSAWSNGMMQRLLQLAGKSSEAAQCLEKHELVTLAAGELLSILDSVAAG